MKFVGIVGTNAKKSYNRQLLTFMQQHFAAKAEIEILSLANVPMFDESDDQSESSVIQEFVQKIEAADGVIFATPEYDHSIPAVLKSAIEWLSYTTRPLISKPVMIVGASNGSLGTSRAQAHLRQILEAPELKALVMPNVEYLLGHSLQAFDAAGNLKDATKAAELADDFTAFMAFVDLTAKITPANKFVEKNQQFSWSQVADGRDL